MVKPKKINVSNDKIKLKSPEMAQKDCLQASYHLGKRPIKQSPF